MTARALPQLGRHQAAALLATAVDWLGMVLLAEGAGLRPSLAALAGSAAGAVCNFELGRRWVFGAPRGEAAGQALRYGAVSAASAALNALGVELGEAAGLSYLPSRLAAAALVSVLWNFPMHRAFVFGGRREPG